MNVSVLSGFGQVLCRKKWITYVQTILMSRDKHPLCADRSRSSNTNFLRHMCSS